MKVNEKSCILNPSVPIGISTSCHNIARKLYLEITSACNSSCIHCFNDSGISKNEMSLGDVRNICTSFLRSKTIQTIILSGGEAALHPSFKAIALMLLPYSNVQVLSNGKALNDELIDFLINNGIHVQITLNGTTNAIDEQIRGIGFDKTVATIKRFDAMNASSLLSITMTLCKLNYQQIEAMAEFCSTVHVNHLIYSFVYKKGRAVANWEALKLSIPEKIDCIDRVAKLQRHYAQTIDIRTSGFKQLARELGQISAEDDYSCYDMAETLSVDGNLNVSLCPRIDRYLECKHIKPAHMVDLSDMQINIPSRNHTDRCGSCGAKSACIVDCLDYPY